YRATINAAYIKSYWYDTRDIAVSPLTWSRGEWIAAGSVIAATALMTTQDAGIQKFAQLNRNETTDRITKYGLEPWGSGFYSIPLMGVFYLHGLVFDNQRSKKTAMLAAKGYIISGILVNVPKYLLNRHRPYNDDPPDPMLFNGMFAGKFYKSMPSGHTTSVFTVAAVIASEYRDKWYVPVISYTIAGLTGLSRIHDNKHWASDVLAGAAFGWAMGKLVHSRNNWGVKVGLYTGEKASGMTLVCPLNR
ncbi:MAG: phosphatase PAP2 family protein, partial [Bacteroidetes bacterium]|nr:phosphatase PAP2 family protein [Bacteroidota bacterium]